MPGREACSFPGFWSLSLTLPAVSAGLLVSNVIDHAGCACIKANSCTPQDQPVLIFKCSCFHMKVVCEGVCKTSQQCAVESHVLEQSLELRAQALSAMISLVFFPLLLSHAWQHVLVCATIQDQIAMPITPCRFKIT